MGIAPDGSIQHNGLDHWWDDQGEGNCWEGNTYSRGEQTDNFTRAPACVRRRRLALHAGRAGQGRRASCPAASTTGSDPTFRHPPGCEWFDDPQEPSAEGGPGLPLSARGEDSTMAAPVLAVTGLLLLVAGFRRRKGDRRAA